MTHDEATIKERELREQIRAGLLQEYGITEEDVAKVDSDSEYALSVLQFGEDVEQTVLWKKVAVSNPYIIKVGYKLTAKTEGVKIPEGKGEALKE